MNRHSFLCMCRLCIQKRQDRMIARQKKLGRPTEELPKPPWAPYPCVRNGEIVGPDYKD